MQSKKCQQFAQNILAESLAASINKILIYIETRLMSNKTYEVEEIVGTKIINNKTYYRIKWTGYPSWQNTWQPEEHLNKESLQYYKQKLKKKLQIQQIKQQQKSLKKQSQTVAKKLEILNHFQKDGELMFTVKPTRGATRQWNRDLMIKKHSQQLIQYYIKLAKQKNKY